MGRGRSIRNGGGGRGGGDIARAGGTGGRDPERQAERVVAAVRRLREAGFAAADGEFDLWLLALYCGETTPEKGATAMGIDPRTMRTRISRWEGADGWRGLVVRPEPGCYELTHTGKTRAEKWAFEVGRQFSGFVREWRDGSGLP
jgi:hypothetical protein